MKSVAFLLWMGLCVSLVQCKPKINSDSVKDELQLDANAADDTTSTSSVPVDLLQENLSWSCANNATCVQTVTAEVLNRLREHQPIDLGGMRVEPLEEGEQHVVGGDARSLSIMSVISGNALKIPLGPMLISVQRSKRYADYLEFALLKKHVGKEHGTNAAARFQLIW